MNNYLKNKMGEEFSCKDFRTYASNYLFLEILKQFDIPQTKREIQENLKETFNEVAKELGHTK
jgi:DNA topoisomerase-1